MLSPSLGMPRTSKSQCLSEPIEKSVQSDLKLDLHFILAVGSEPKTIGSMDKRPLEGFQEFSLVKRPGFLFPPPSVQALL